MAHTTSDTRRQQRERELAADAIREERRDLNHAKRLVAIWNLRARRGRRVTFFPTIGTALAANTPILEVLCPACQTVGEVDIRKLDRHPDASLSSLIRRCRAGCVIRIRRSQSSLDCGQPEALDDRSPRPDRVWNRIPDDVRARIVTLALDESELSPRELAVRFTDVERYFVSEASVYRLLKAHDLITSPAYSVMKAADEFKDKTTAPNQLWQTDFTYLKVTGWGWFYLSTVLDDFSRYIVAWKLCTTMKADDVTDTLELALQASGLDQVNVAHRPRLLSDNGPSYVSTELAAWLDKQDMRHIRGAPYHPMTQGKIERWHLTLKNRILLENYYLPGQLEAQIEAFVAHYNHLRYHESIDNLTPADVYFGRGQTILLERERIKNEKPSNNDACFTKLTQPKMNPDAPELLS